MAAPLSDEQRFLHDAQAALKDDFAVALVWWSAQSAADKAHIAASYVQLPEHERLERLLGLFSQFDAALIAEARKLEPEDLARFQERYHHAKPMERVTLVNAFAAAPDKIDFLLDFCDAMDDTMPAPAPKLLPVIESASSPVASRAASPVTSRAASPITSRSASPAVESLVAPPRTKMLVDKDTFRERKFCAAIVRRRRRGAVPATTPQSSVCGTPLKSELSARRGFCSSHARRLQIELDDECIRVTAEADRLKESISVRSMQLSVQEHALERREQLDKRLVDMKAREAEVEAKRARLAEGKHHKEARAYAEGLQHKPAATFNEQVLNFYTNPRSQ